MIETLPYCVIGDPIEHSLSPVIHNYIFSRMGFSASYEKVYVVSSDLPRFVEETLTKKRPGFNVTIPHKESIMPLLDAIDPAAEHIGAVNTVVNRNGHLTGYNTDVYGCMRALERAGFSSKGKVIMLGAGGAARAAIEALGRMGLSEIVLFDLVRERCQILSNHFSPLHPMKITIGFFENKDLETHLPGADLLINATPVGMWPKVHQSPLPCPEFFPEKATIFDMIYRPMETQLMKDVSSKQAVTVSGLTMLVGQAIAADELYFDCQIPEHLFQETITEVNHFLSSHQ